MIKVILVDDEEMAIEVLTQKLLNYEEVEIVGKYTDPYEALSVSKKLDIDAVFLDIQMGGKDGIELGQLLLNNNPNIEIVFVTAYNQYAIEAFELNAIDYLLKPIQGKRLDKTINRILNRNKIRELRPIGEVSTDKGNAYIKSFGKFEILDQEEKIIHWRTQKTKELFAYFWLNKGKLLSKDLIIDTIFPDRDLEKGTTILHTTIYQIRKVLEQLEYAEGLTYTNSNYCLDIYIKSDRETIYNILERDIVNDNNINMLYEIYKGDFFQEEGYTWIANEQQKLRDMVFNRFQNYILEKFKEKNYSIKLEKYINKMIEIDPLRECAIRYLMELYGENKLYSKLNLLYQDYEKYLFTEMGMSLMVETQELYKKYIDEEENIEVRI